MEQSEIYTPVFARAGLTKLNLFFFINNRVLGVNSYITLVFRTHMRIFFLHLGEF
jgi:hypothetical protein